MERGEEVGIKKGEEGEEEDHARGWMVRGEEVGEDVEMRRLRGAEATTFRGYCDCAQAQDNNCK